LHACIPSEDLRDSGQPANAPPVSVNEQPTTCVSMRMAAVTRT
jgi:hypothetical protein